MAMRRLGWVLLCSVWVQAGAAVACFRTPKEAAAQTGVRDGVGFRLEGVRVDQMGGGRWATVADCAHPERPSVMVKVGGISPGAFASPATRATQPAYVPSKAGLAVHAGTAVRLVLVEALSRIEMPGVAQANGAVGDRVLVRVGAAPERFLDGIVRGEALVEMEAAQ